MSRRFISFRRMYGLLTGAGILFCVPFSPGCEVVAQEHHGIAAVAVVGGGHPVRDVKVPDGTFGIEPGPGRSLIFTAEYDHRFPLVSAAAAVEALPLAGTISTTIELEIVATACPRPDQPPQVTCQWEVANARLDGLCCRPVPAVSLRGRHSWQGWSDRLTVPVPDATGIYDLTLSCKVEGRKTREIRRRLYATYGEPLFVVSPPATAWYEKACCWGAGFDREAEEAAILKAMLKGLHLYGSAYWRYGYARKVNGDLYQFQVGGDETIGIITDKAWCDANNYCKCPWQSLVTTRDTCQFSDCHIFSDTLQFIAATLGIGGLLDCNRCHPRGANGNGFLTGPGFSSLDLEFPGNITCRSDEALCPAYYFNGHSLLWKDGYFYDATFNRIHKELNQLVWVSPQLVDSHAIFVNDTAAYVRDSARDYGRWWYYKQPTGYWVLSEPSLSLEATPVSFSKSDTDDFGISEYLIAEVTVEVLSDGIHQLNGVLTKNGKVVASRPSWDSMHRTHSTFTAKRGERHMAQLQFSGEQIYDSKKNGPYTLTVWSADAKMNFEVPAYSYNHFGELDARFHDVKWEYSEGEGADGLLVSVCLAVREPNVFTVQMRLAQDGRTIANAGQRCKGCCSERLDCCSERLELKVPVSVIAGSGLRGPYLLTLELYEGRGLHSIDYRIIRDLPGPDRSP